jgi:hypothetical protein
MSIKIISFASTKKPGIQATTVVSGRIKHRAVLARLTSKCAPAGTLAQRGAGRGDESGKPAALNKGAEEVSRQRKVQR